MSNHRLENDKNLETEMLIGIDEVGRGPLAGPVVACAVYIHDKSLYTQALPTSIREVVLMVQDSKKVKPNTRKTIIESLSAYYTYGIGESTVEEIDAINILQASLKSMERAYDNLKSKTKEKYHLALVDGTIAPSLPCPVKTVIKGDDKHFIIALASIIAKDYRDSLMEKLGDTYPQYQWAKNKGYGTQAHKNAIQSYGYTPHHRKSFMIKESREEKNNGAD